MSEYIVDEKNWYYLKNDIKYGPYDEEEIISLIKEGIIKDDYGLWFDELNDWILLKDSIFSFYKQD